MSIAIEIQVFADEMHYVCSWRKMAVTMKTYTVALAVA